MNPLPKHLGGHANVTHIDKASVIYLKNKYSLWSAYDVGCGPGGMVEAMLEMGMECTGIDGDYTLQRKVPVIIHDFSVAPLQPEPRDFCWCVEFLEHVEEKYMDNYFPVFSACHVILATASQNPKAHHHVNVKPCSYWINAFTERGFTYSEEDTVYIRKNSSMKRDFVRETGMVFVRP
jgi:hypothetical protein